MLLLERWRTTEKSRVFPIYVLEHGILQWFGNVRTPSTGGLKRCVPRLNRSVFLNASVMLLRIAKNK